MTRSKRGPPLTNSPFHACCRLLRPAWRADAACPRRPPAGSAPCRAGSRKGRSGQRSPHARPHRPPWSGAHRPSACPWHPWSRSGPRAPLSARPWPFHRRAAPAVAPSAVGWPGRTSRSSWPLPGSTASATRSSASALAHSCRVSSRSRQVSKRASNARMSSFGSCPLTLKASRLSRAPTNPRFRASGPRRAACPTPPTRTGREKATLLQGGPKG